MASIEYVVNATDLASRVFARIAASADGLDEQLARLSKRIATPEVDLKDAKFTAGIISAAKRVDKLSAMMAKPGADLEDGKFQAEILKVNAQLDRLDAKKVTATVEVKTDTSFLSRLWGGKGGAGGKGGSGILGLLSGAGGGAASAGGGLGGTPALYGAGGLLAALLAPAAIGTGIGGAVGLGAVGGGLFGAAQGKTVLAADLKNISQITTSLKTAIGQQKQQLSQALKDANRQYAKDAAFYAPFTAFQGAIKGLAQTILKPLRPIMAPLTGIISQFGKGLTALGPQMTTMFRASLPFIRQFATVMLQAGKILMPAFTQAMNQMVKSGALKLMTQGLVILIQGFARFVVALGPGMKASAQIFVFVSKVIALALQGIGKTMAWLANKIVQRVEDWRRTFDDFRHRTAVIFDGIRHDIAHVWDLIWNNTIGRIIRGVNDVHHWDANMRHDIAGIYDSIRHDIAAAWDTIWNNTVGRVRSGISTVIGWFRGLPGRAVTALLGLGTRLYNLGSGWLISMWNGIKHVWNSVIGWFRNLPGAILRAIGIGSPPKWAINAGEWIMKGLHIGMKGTLHTVLGFAGSLGHLVTSGIGAILPGGIPAAGNVGGVAALAKAMAAARGWTGTLWDALNAVEMREAGWNLRAVNPSSGAYGIAQFIQGPSEYARYGGNASTAAGQVTGFLNYVAQRYGNPVRAWQHEQAFGWYGSGFHGVVDRPRIFGVGERGAERVDITPVASSKPGRQGPLVNVQNMTVQDATDVKKVAAELSFRIVTSSFG